MSRILQSTLFGAPEEIKEEKTIWGAKKRKPTVANGYAAAPGTGPKGETCKTCDHHIIWSYAKNYHKCELLGKKLTHGTGTDIRVRSPSCSYWVGCNTKGDAK